MNMSVPGSNAGRSLPRKLLLGVTPGALLCGAAAGGGDGLGAVPGAPGASGTWAVAAAKIEAQRLNPATEGKIRRARWDPMVFMLSLHPARATRPCRRLQS